MKIIVKIKSDLIFDYIKENNLSINAFCKLCGISKVEFNNILNCKGGYKKFIKVVDILKIALEDLVERINV